MKNDSLLVQLLGFHATLIHGDTLVVDRWYWLRKRLPKTRNRETLLDVGCGTGAFTVGAAKRGYTATGISWDERNQAVASQRAALCGATLATFVVGDVRRLDELNTLEAHYDVVICLECIEHIIDDDKLMRDIANKIKPGGRLLLTTPYGLYVPIDRFDAGPFHKTETGWHVRKGYSAEMLHELCQRAGLILGCTSYCGGFLSQKVTGVWRLANKTLPSKALSWLVTLPLRIVPFILWDDRLTRWSGWPYYSICIEAYKPRFALIDRGPEPDS